MELRFTHEEPQISLAFRNQFEGYQTLRIIYLMSKQILNSVLMIKLSLVHEQFTRSS